MVFSWHLLHLLTNASHMRFAQSHEETSLSPRLANSRDRQFDHLTTGFNRLPNGCCVFQHCPDPGPILLRLSNSNRLNLCYTKATGAIGLPVSCEAFAKVDPVHWSQPGSTSLWIRYREPSGMTQESTDQHLLCMQLALVLLFSGFEHLAAANPSLAVILFMPISA